MQQHEEVELSALGMGNRFPPYAMIALYSNSEQLWCSMRHYARAYCLDLESHSFVVSWFTDLVYLMVFYHDSPWLLIVWGLTVLPWGFFSAYCLASYLLTFMWTAPLNECGNPCVAFSLIIMVSFTSWYHLKYIPVVKDTFMQTSYYTVHSMPLHFVHIIYFAIVLS